MQYWANINGTQSGPVEKEELLALGLTPESYVWREGLEDWIQVKSFDELADLFAEKPEEANPVAADEPVEGVPEAEAVQPSTDTADVPVEGAPEAEATVASAPADEATTQAIPVSQTPPPLPEQNVIYVPQPAPMPQMPASQIPVAPTEPCPPTNLVWAIIATVLCCQIFGIIAIIYAAMVSSKYQAGDIEAAKKYSDRAAGWTIAAIVTGVITMPIAAVLQLMAL